MKELIKPNKMLVGSARLWPQGSLEGGTGMERIDSGGGFSVLDGAALVMGSADPRS